LNQRYETQKFSKVRHNLGIARKLTAAANHQIERVNAEVFWLHVKQKDDAGASPKVIMQRLFVCLLGL
jgi:hypothetical protein